MRARLLWIVALAGCPSPARPPVPATPAPPVERAAVDPATLVTTGERSGYVRTGHYAEAIDLCERFPRAFAHVSCGPIGTTAEGRPIVALTIERHPKLPWIYVQGGIHAGEIEGKDAGFAFFRDLLEGKVAPGALDAANVVFVPVLNPDGHERFGPNNRPNQRGPEDMGFRTNGARLNINRDFIKADTEETQAMLGVMRARDPVLVIDLHTTDGAKFQHDVSINVAPVAPRADRLDEAADAFRDALIARLTELGHLPLRFYPSFVKDDDPSSGFGIGEAPPRFSQFYAAARGRLGLLVENHSWRTYKERVKSTYDTLRAVFEDARTQAAMWRRIADETSRADAALGGTRLPVMWKPSGHTTQIAFRGYAYEKRESEISGGTWIVYDETKPQIWNIPLYDELVPAITVDVPRAGYIVDAGFAKQVGTILALHGVQYRLIRGAPRVQVEVFRASKVTYNPPYEGRTRPDFEGAWTTETRTLEHGAIFVPIAQPFARLAIHMLDPALPDSLAKWGFFNTAFEQKEYMESYVAEEQARAMIAKDPSLKTKFEAALAADPKLAADPAKRLHWFYERHPSWDERVNLLPVYRVATDPRPRRR